MKNGQGALSPRSIRPMQSRARQWIHSLHCEVTSYMVSRPDLAISIIPFETSHKRIANQSFPNLSAGVAWPSQTQTKKSPKDCCCRSPGHQPQLRCTAADQGLPSESESRPMRWHQEISSSVQEVTASSPEATFEDPSQSLSAAVASGRDLAEPTENGFLPSSSHRLSMPADGAMPATQADASHGQPESFRSKRYTFSTQTRQMDRQHAST